MSNIRTSALLLLAVAAGNSAQAQAKKVPAGVAYTIGSVTAATGTGISYLWYRDGQPIHDAADESYTVPAAEAVGNNVEFKRGVKSTSCVGDVVFSNAAVLSFCNLVVNGICWADANAATPGTFAELPDMHTQYYQWNRPSAAWAAAGAVSGWNAASISDPAWTSTPCPAGWRLPAIAEFQALLDAGTTWADAGTRGAAVAGRFFGPNHAVCTLPSDMYNCIFMHAGGGRDISSGAITNSSSGFYWSSTQHSLTHGRHFGYGKNNISASNNMLKAYGLSIRCVQ